MRPRPAAQTFLEPRWLRPNGVLAVVAPSGPFDVPAFERGLERLRARYRVRCDPSILARHGYLAGDDARRLREMTDAIEDETVDAIVCARGGYGATRLLEHLDPAKVRASRKLLVGFSDVTALHALWARAGVGSLHAPMVAALGRTSDALVDRYVRALEGAPMPRIEGLASIEAGVAEGPLVGGNLAVLAALVGTPYAPPVDGCVLFLEDVGERPYRVDRMLTTLRQAGWLDRVAGVALGAFTEGPPGPDGVDLDTVLRERLGGLGIPVVSGIPAGHVDDNLELRFGVRVRIDASAGCLEPL